MKTSVPIDFVTVCAITFCIESDVHVYIELEEGENGETIQMVGCSICNKKSVGHSKFTAFDT